MTGSKCMMQTQHRGGRDGMPASWSSHLIHVMVAQNSIKQCVEVIEQAHHLNGLTQGWDGGKAYSVTEVYSNLVKVLWLHSRPHFQSFSHRPEGMGRARVTRWEDHLSTVGSERGIFGGKSWVECQGIWDSSVGVLAPLQQIPAPLWTLFPLRSDGGPCTLSLFPRERGSRNSTLMCPQQCLIHVSILLKYVG